MKQGRSVSHFMNIAKVTSILWEEHGDLSAQKLAMTEVRKARRARCRKRFHFWTSVASQLSDQSRAAVSKTR